MINQSSQALWDLHTAEQLLKQQVDALSMLLLEKQHAVVVAESCTGGELLAAISAPAGASQWLWGGWVVYSNQAKTVLGVPPERIATHGAVSSEAVQSLSIQAIAQSGAQLAIAVSGIAGPDGATATRPVGLVWMAATYLGRTRCKRLLLNGNRKQIRAAASISALQLGCAILAEETE